jgi:FkbM family methyltransferase
MPAYEATDRWGTSFTFQVRDGTADQVVIDEVWHEGVYRLTPEDVHNKWVMDVGANIGAFTVWAIRHGAGVIAYEPMPDAATILEQHVTQTGPAGSITRLRRAAIGGSDRLGHMSVIRDPNFESISGKLASGAATLADSDSSQLVAVESFAAVLRAWQPHVVKMDIEGGEWEAFGSLVGDPDALASVERITMEFHGPGMGHIPTPDPGWMESWGRLMWVLTEWGHIETLGAASRGGMIYGRRYGL